MTIFLISDTHFSHKNIIHLGNGRPFNDIDHHNEVLVWNWNTTVRPDDIVIHLGDVAMGHRRESLQIFSGLNGYKILIPGNHDYVSATEDESRRERFLDAYEDAFDEIWPDTVQIGRMFLSHYPPAEIPDHGEEDRYPHMRPALVDDALYIHGHTHQPNRVTRLSNGSLAVSVGVDANNWTPVLLNSIEGIQRGDIISLSHRLDNSLAGMVD